MIFHFTIAFMCHAEYFTGQSFAVYVLFLLLVLQSNLEKFLFSILLFRFVDYILYDP